MTMSKGSLCEIIGNRGADENVTFPWHGKPYEVTYTLRATDGKEVSQVSRRFWVIGPREDRFDTEETSIKDANPFSANHLPNSQ